MSANRRDYEWLKRAIEAAAREVATWPAWKRNGSTLKLEQDATDIQHSGGK